jgi:GTP-binding protein
VVENLEFYSVIRAIKAIDEADVCLLILDATQGIESQDLKIFSIIDNKKKGVVVLVNKWDLITKDNHTMAAYEDNIKDRLAPFTDVPIIFISAIEKQRIYKAVDVLLQVFENRQIRIPTSKLNDVMLPEIEKYPPPAYRGEYIKIKYITQLPGKVPTFAFFCNHPDYIKQPYRNYLENKLRSHFTLTGVPINIFFRKK